MKPNWLTIRNEAESAEILIQGAIGASPWDESGVSEKEFTNALKSIPEGRQITVGINSQGGSIQDGLGIYNALRRRGDAVTVRVDGYAVSIASVIALAGAKRISPKSSVWMIHEPAMLAFGNAEDMDRARLALEAHAEVITDIYAERTSLTKDDARAKMKAETWFRGEEAVEMGFATEANDASVALNSLDATKFKTIPDFIKAQLTGPQQGTALASEPIQQPVACAPEISADTVASGRSLPAEGSTNTKGTNMDTTPAANPPATNQVDLSAVMTALNALNAKVDGMKPAEALPPAAPPVAASRVENNGETWRNAIASKAQGRERFEFITNEYSALRQSGAPILPVYNANTVAAALTTDMLANGLILVLQNRLAPLRAFATEFSTDPMKPLAKVQVPMVTNATGAAVANATAFQDTTNFVATVDAVEVTIARVTSGSNVTPAELNSGSSMARYVERKAHELADKIQSYVNAVITTANFDRTAELGTAALVSSGTLFGDDELNQVWAAIGKGYQKNIMLAQSHFKNFRSRTRDGYDAINGGFPGWWDLFALNTYFTGATTNTVGFACNPNAIVVCSGLPLASPNRGTTTAVQTIQLPGIGITVEQQQWYANDTKSDWANWEVMFGAAKGDGTAGCLILSA